MSTDKKELKNLLDELDNYDDAYYNEDKPLVSDKEYDIKKDRLKAIGLDFTPKEGSKSDEKLSIRIKDALTRVGAPPPKDGKWPKVIHEVPMGSLTKVNLPEELKDWHSKCGKTTDLFITEKLDGISISLKYEQGVFVMGCTRGDGNEGENITRNVKKMNGVPQKLSTKFTGHIRGEVVLLHSDWKRYLSEMANARNGAGGIAKRIDGHQSEHLTVISYNIDGEDFETEDQAFEYIKSLGFFIPNYSVGNLEHAINEWQRYMDGYRGTLDYDIDGMVVRINKLSEQYALGDEGGNRPKGARAFKFESPEAGTTIRNIVCQVGDTGRITPVAEFDQVELLGAKIERASIHNFSLVKELCINIGAEVIVERSNDVIPGIKSVTKECNGYFLPPENCPSCNQKTVFVGEYLICTNKKNCPEQVLGRLNKWIKELGILEWGESILTKLIDAGLIKDVADIYKLTPDNIKSLDRMGDKGAANLLTELDKFRSIKLENFLGGMCIDGVATSTVKNVIDAGYDTLDSILGLTTKQLEKIPGFAEKRALAFHSGLIENKDRIQAILNAGVTVKGRAKGVLTGKSFAITGSTELSRKELVKFIEDNGGEFKKSVSKDCSYLIIADPSSTSSKAQAARKLGIVLITEQDLIKLAFW